MAEIGKKIINYTLNKLFFPKVVRIDKPGIIYNKTSQKYGKQSSKKRQIWHFEDIFAYLQQETLKELGSDKTSELFYKIGKDVGMRYMLLAKAKKVPMFLQPLVIHYLFDNLRSSGISASNKVTFNKEKKEIILEGENNLFCRKSGQGSIVSGLVSGIISPLFGENLEAELKCKDCPMNCQIIINKRIEKKYIPIIKKLQPLSTYEKLNFPENIKVISKRYSFRDFIRNGLVKLDESGKFIFNNVPIAPAEHGFFGIVYTHYSEIHKKKFLLRCLVRGAEKIAPMVLNKGKTIDGKLNFLVQIFCAFGYGIPYYKKEKNSILFNFVYPPISKYDDYLYTASILNGFLNNIYNKKANYKILKKDLKSLNIHYTF